jgi:hypothetical protein
MLLKDERIKIGAVFCRVVKIETPNRFVLEVEGSMLRQYTIDSEKPSEVLPGVTVQAGNGERRYRAAVVINAPANIRISRLADQTNTVRFGNPTSHPKEA